MKLSIQSLLSVLLLFIVLSCSSSNVDSSKDGDIYRNQTGLLRWTGSPAVDGTGLLLEIDETQFGVSGVPGDYPDLFRNDNIHEVEVRADFRLTGKETVRGWGATFPEIEILRIEQI